MCILFVEDEVPIRRMAQEVLEDAGHEVLAAESGREACEYMNSYPDRFTCMVTDYNMPGELHGGHVIEHARATYRDFPIILASGYLHVAPPGWRRRHRVELLPKPYSLRFLVELVGRLVA